MVGERRRHGCCATAATEQVAVLAQQRAAAARQGMPWPAARPRNDWALLAQHLLRIVGPTGAC